MVDRFPNWKVSLKTYELEVYVNVIKADMILGVSLSHRPTVLPLFPCAVRVLWCVCVPRARSHD
jgi:hypothetical protein